MSDYELNKNKKSDKIKWIATGVAVILLAGTFVTTIAMGVTSDEPKINVIETHTGGGMILSEENETTETGGIRLLSTRIAEEDFEANGISAQSDSAYTVTAKVVPESATESVRWSVAWKNASSTWANGKTVTDYVTVSSAGALTANLSCKQAFGEVVVLKVAADSDASICATREINYMKRASSFDFYTNCSGGGSGSLTVESEAPASLVCRPNWGVGTVTGTVTVSSATLTWSETYVHLDSAISEANATVTSGAVISFARTKTFTDPTSLGGLALSWRDFFTASGAGMFSIGSEAENILKSAIVELGESNLPGYAKVTASITVTYGDVSESYTQETNVTKLDVSALSVNITNLSYSDNSALTF